MDSGIKRYLLDLKGLTGHLLNSLGDGIAVDRCKRNDPHDEEIEGTLREIKAVFSHHDTCHFYRYVEGQGIQVSAGLNSAPAETGVRGREIRVIEYVRVVRLHPFLDALFVRSPSVPVPARALGLEFRLSLSHHSLQNHSRQRYAVGNN